jgi:hypothetical protein
MYNTDDIEAALGAAEMLLQLPPWQGQGKPLEKAWQQAASRELDSEGQEAGHGVAGLAETALELRLTRHEREMELLRLRQEHAQALVRGLHSFGAADASTAELVLDAAHL